MRSVGHLAKRPAAGLASHLRRVGGFARRRVALFERRQRAIYLCIDCFGAPAPADDARW